MITLLISWQFIVSVMCLLPSWETRFIRLRSGYGYGGYERGVSNWKQRNMACASIVSSSSIDSSQPQEFTNLNQNNSAKSGASFHLVSLPPLYAPSSSSSLLSTSSQQKISPKCIRDVWSWKDKCLGDGRDYFVPRPRAIKALCDLLLEVDDKIFLEHGVTGIPEGKVKEVAVLSNCARMDILFVVESSSSESCCIDQLLCLHTASTLARQVCSYNDSRKGSVLWDTLGVGSVLDLPGMIDEDPPTAIDVERVKEMAEELNHLNGIENVSRHLCRVAIGVADRPSRPGRQVLFRPFSSRDAHIMLQLKRTKEVSIGRTAFMGSIFALQHHF